MRRLIRRLRRERGATAVLFGVLLIPLLGGLAISVDVGALYAEKAQLQNGADAAALAVARECAIDDDCSGSAAVAAPYSSSNALDGAATTLQPTFPNATTVTVEVSTKTSDGSGAMRHPFAALIGIDASTVRAAATATWGAPRAGSVVPLALSYCDFKAAGFDKLAFVRYDQNKACSGPEGKPIMGGFGWLDQLPGQCEAYIDLANATVGSDPGNDPPKNCESLFQTLEGSTILIPVYKCSQDVGDADCSTGINGQKGEFKIWAFAAFHVTGWIFSGVGNGIMYNPDPNAPGCTSTPGGNGNGGNGNGGNGNGNGGNGGNGGSTGGTTSANNCRGIQGYFDQWVEVGDYIPGGAGTPNAGVDVVALID